MSSSSGLKNCMTAVLGIIFSNALNGLLKETLETAVFWVIFPNCVSTTVPVTVFITGTPEGKLLYCFVVETKLHSKRILIEPELLLKITFLRNEE